MRCIVIAAVLLALVGNAGADQTDDFKREGTPDQRKRKDPLEKKAPPALIVKDWMNTDGKELKFDELRGKVVVLDFWGVWCGPCIAAMPKLRDLHEKHKADGLVIIGVHTTRQGDKMAAFVKEQKLPWPVAVDVEGKTVQAFAVDSFPDYYLIDRSGKLRVADLANGDLERAVQLLLKERPTQ